MTRYRVFGLVVESQVPLPAPSARGRPDCVLRVRRGVTPSRGAGPRHVIRLPGGAIASTVARLPSGYLVRFPRVADFEISRDGREVAAMARRGTRTRDVARLFVAQVLPLVLSRRGKLVLHAGAVVTPAGALAFVGAAGRGKSTLCATFAEEGFPIVADDGLLLVEAGGSLAAVPSYPEIRLWPDSLAALGGFGNGARRTARGSGKQRLRLRRGRWPFSREAVPLRRVYVLDGPGPVGSRADIGITALGRRDAFMELVKHAHRLDFDDRAALRGEFDAIGRLARRLTLYRLRVRRDLRRLPAVRAAILEHVRR